MRSPTDSGGLVRSVLEEEREFFLQSLRDLEAERVAGDIDAVDYRSLRDDYTVRAAEVVRRLAALESSESEADAAAGGATSAEGGSSSGAAAPTVDAPRGRAAHSWRRRVVVGTAALVVTGGVAAAVVVLSGSSQSRAARVQKLDVAAQDAIGNRQYERAVADYEAALKIEPTDVVTLTGEGELLVEVGADRSQGALTLQLGLQRLGSAEIADPSYGPAFGARGIGLFDEGDYAAAIPQLESYLADTPRANQSPAIRQTLVTAQKRVATDVRPG